LEKIDFGEDVLHQVSVTLHLGVFVLAQTALLAEKLCRDGEFADVVNQRRPADSL
jgi:hypothetical protein